MPARFPAAAVVVVSLPVLGAASVALAEESTLPVAFVERPLTLPARTIQPALDVTMTQAHRVSEASLLDAKLGVTDDVQLAAGLLPLRFKYSATYDSPQSTSTSVAYGGPRLEAIARFVRGPVEIGAALTYQYAPRESVSHRAMLVAPVLVHAARFLRIDSGLGVGIEGSQGDVAGTEVPVNFPLAVSLQLGRHVHLGLRGAAQLYLWREATLTVPLGAFAGVVVSDGKHPLVEASASFTWTAFARPFANTPEKVQLATYAITLGVAWFLFT